MRYLTQLIFFARSQGSDGQEWYYYFYMEMAQSFQKEKQFEKAISCLEQAQKYALHHQNVNAQVLLLVTTFPSFFLHFSLLPSPRSQSDCFY